MVLCIASDPSAVIYAFNKVNMVYLICFYDVVGTAQDNARSVTSSLPIGCNFWRGTRWKPLRFCAHSPRSCCTISSWDELFPAQVGSFRDGNGKKCVRADLSVVVSKKGGIRCAGGSGFPSSIWAALLGRIHRSSPARWGRLASCPRRHREKGRTGKVYFGWISTFPSSPFWTEQEEQNLSPRSVFS